MNLQRLRQDWDRALGWVAAVGGAVALAAGWLGVSGTAFPAKQLPYILSGGIGGIFLLGLAAILLLTADLRDEWTKLDRIEHLLRGEPADAASRDGADLDDTEDGAEVGSAAVDTDRMAAA